MTSHIKINKFPPKNNNDIMQCVIFNKSSLFASKERKKKRLKNSNILEVPNINSFLYEIETLNLFLKY
jgi:hypothetical protein